MSKANPQFPTDYEEWLRLPAYATKPVKPALPLFTGQAIQVSTEEGLRIANGISPFRVVREYATQ